MDPFQWEKKYEVGIPKVDDQHRTLVDMLNNLNAAKKTEQAPQVIEQTLRGLLNYTKTHFADEETAMRDAKYPELARHRLEHLDLTDQVMLLQKEAPVTFELLSFMSDWLKFHICDSDRKFGAYLQHQQSAKSIDP